MQEIINLKGLLNIYTNTVCDKIFEFTLPKNKKIKLAFYRESMCHLMGLQYIFDNDKHYLGASGYSKIVTEEITVKSLKKHNKAGFNYIKNRLIYFDEIIDIVTNGEIFLYSKYDCPDSKINANIVLHKYVNQPDEELVIYELNLFMIKEGNEELYVPISFFPQFPSDRSFGKYISNKSPIKKKNINIMNIDGL